MFAWCERSACKAGLRTAAVAFPKAEAAIAPSPGKETQHVVRLRVSGGKAPRLHKGDHLHASGRTGDKSPGGRFHCRGLDGGRELGSRLQTKTAGASAKQKASMGAVSGEHTGYRCPATAFARQRNSSEIKVHAENWDFAEHIDEIVRYCSTRRTFPFILIDPTGWKLAGISQISPLLKLKPGEVVINNLMSSFITRFVNDTATDLSDLLGEDFSELRSLSGTELEFAVVRKYCDLIKREGDFSYVCALPVMKPDSDAFNFYLIYATRHPKGVEVFKSVEKRTSAPTTCVCSSVLRKG